MNGDADEKRTGTNDAVNGDADEKRSDETTDSMSDGVVFDGRTIRFDAGELNVFAAEDAESNGEPDAWNEDGEGGEAGNDESAEGALSNDGNDGAVSNDDSGGGFLKFFDSSADQAQKSRFERRFQTFFEPEALHEIDENDENDSDAQTVANDESDFADEESDADDLTLDEFVRRELTEALDENVEAVNHNEDADSLYVLGAKYETSGDDVNMPEGETAELSPTSILEAMLFVGDWNNQPLDPEKAADLMRNVRRDEICRSIEELNRRYAQRGSPYRILEENGGYRMALLPEVDSVRERFGAKVREVKLSQKAIDALAVIAYRQPVTLAEIQTERPNSGAVVSLLVKRGLVAVETKTVDKKPVQYYRTAERFLKLLGIDSLDDLPIVDEIDYR